MALCCRGKHQEATKNELEQKKHRLSQMLLSSPMLIVFWTDFDFKRTRHVHKDIRKHGSIGGQVESETRRFDCAGAIGSRARHFRKPHKA